MRTMAGEIIEVLDKKIYYTIAAVYILTMLTTIITNSIVIVTFYKVRCLLTPSSLPILSLAMADLVLAVTVMPFGIVANANRIWLVGDFGCHWYAYGHTVVGFSSILHHGVIAVEAARKIVRGFRNAGARRRGMITTIVVVWAVVLVWGTMPLIGWSSYGPEGSGAVCSINWKSTDPTDVSFVMITFVLFLFIPVIIIMACYTVISYDLRRMARIAEKQWGRKAQMTIARVLAKKKSMWTGLIMFVAIFFVWMPYAIISFLSVIGTPEKIPPLAFALAAMFAKTSTFVNPLICFFWYHKFRDGTKRIYRNSKRMASLQKAWTTSCNEAACEIHLRTNSYPYHSPDFRQVR